MPESTTIRTKRDGQIAILDNGGSNTYTVAYEPGDFKFDVPGEGVGMYLDRGVIGATPSLRYTDQQAMSLGFSAYLRDIGDSAGSPTYATLPDICHPYASGYVDTTWVSTMGANGEVFTVPEVTLRPRPVSADLADCLLVAATSDETLIEGGRRGLGMIYSGQKSTGLTRSDVQLLNRERIANGFAPTQPVLQPWVFCSRSEQEAKERVMQASADLLLDLTNNYDQGSWEKHDRTQGYDHFVRETTAGLDLDRYSNMQVYGTPEQCLEQIRALQEETGARNISLQVQWGDITHDEALSSLTLFAGQCMDRLHTISAPLPEWLSVDVLSAEPVAAS